MENWLEQLKPGDRVIRHYGWNEKDIVRVNRVTKTQIIVKVLSYEQRFSRVSGRDIGGQRFNKAFISRATPEIIHEIKTKNIIKKLMSYLKNFDWQIMSIEDLETIKTITDKYKGGNENNS